MMIDKKILWLSGAGAAVVSIAVVITVNVVVNNSTDTDQPASNTRLSCKDLQQAINDIGQPGFDLLPEEIKKHFIYVKQDHSCSLTGKDWSLIDGKIAITTKPDWRPNIGAETEVDTTKGIDPGNLQF